MMVKVVKNLQSVVDIPLQIDSSDVRAIEAGVRACNGKPASLILSTESLKYLNVRLPYR